MAYITDVVQKAQGEQGTEEILLPWENTYYKNLAPVDVKRKETKINEVKPDQVNTDYVSSDGVQPDGVKKTILKVPNLLQHFSDGVIYDFQRILENIFSLGQKHNVQIIGITSAHSHEGTSTIVAVLSLLAAARQAGYFHASKKNNTQELPLKKLNNPFQNILLIDTQLKNPTLHSLFGFDAQPGLGDYLESRITFQASIRHLANSRLKIMPAGQRTDQPLYHLYFDVFYALLERFRPYIHLIFMDIPPLLEYAEGITLSKLCDGIILNVKSASTRWEAVKEAKGLLEQANVRILGTILNRRKSYVPNWVSKFL